jgi:hypothetical protein
MSDHSGLAVPAPRLQPSQMELDAREAVIAKVRQPISPERLAELRAMGRKDPEPEVVPAVVPADQLASLIAAADRALQDAGFRSGPRPHRNREE